MVGLRLQSPEPGGPWRVGLRGFRSGPRASGLAVGQHVPWSLRSRRADSAAVRAAGSPHPAKARGLSPCIQQHVLGVCLPLPPGSFLITYFVSTILL